MRFLPVTALLFASSLMAQGPGQGRMAPVMPPLTEITAYLALSDAQVTQLTDLRKQLRDAASPLMTQAADKRKALADLLSAGNTDTATIGQLRQDLKGIRKQMRDLDTQYGTSARNVLNADQQTKLQALEEAAKLMPTIRQAEALNLIERVGPFGGMMGPRPGHMGAGGMRRQPGQ